MADCKRDADKPQKASDPHKPDNPGAAHPPAVPSLPDDADEGVQPGKCGGMPGASDSPEAVIFFDGVCNLCNGFVRFVLRNDPKGHFRFAALQSDYAHRSLRHLNIPEATSRQSVILLQQGKIYTASDAALRILAAFPNRLRHLSKLKVIPKFMRDAVYRFIARNRYRWFGKTGACPLPRPEHRGRFL